MINILAPQKLRMNMGEIGLVECTDENAMLSADFAISRMSNNKDGFPQNFLPVKTRVNAALLGAFHAHERIKSYDPHNDLQSMVEYKINKTGSEIRILAINTASVYYCFTTKSFTYDQLVELKKQTYAIDFIVLLENRDGFFVFHDDDPACIMSFSDERTFAENFISSPAANSIFREQMMNWKITTLPSESKWLRTIQIYTSPLS